MELIERFLEYVKIDTGSGEDTGTHPSTPGQFDLARLLVNELREMGVEDVTFDEEHCYVYAKIPASEGCENAMSLGLIAHMDTATAMTGKDVKPRIVKEYDGGVIVLNEEKSIVLSPEEFPSLLGYVGKDLIVTDGTTLLGADDKAGVAAIMQCAEYLLTHPEVKHGPLRLAFTPDEEIGEGPDFFDVKGFDAKVAYTVDGGALGELEYENFNAASGIVKVSGKSVHPGSAKNCMINALLVMMEFEAMLPKEQKPMYTEGYEGFFHLDRMEGNVENARGEYIIRDHDPEKFEAKKQLFIEVADFLNKKYGEGTVTVIVKDSYRNMREIIDDHYFLIEMASQVLKEMGIEPVTCPIRGGTDGAQLSFKGLPCPNLGTGGHNFHGKYEYACVQSMEKNVEFLTALVTRFADRK